MRAVYDALLSNRGRSVSLSALGVKCGKRITAFLNDYYGMDIVWEPGKQVHTLRGEWFGSTYVDYTKCPAPASDSEAA